MTEHALRILLVKYPGEVINLLECARGDIFQIGVHRIPPDELEVLSVYWEFIEDELHEINQLGVIVAVQTGIYIDPELPAVPPDECRQALDHFQGLPVTTGNASNLLVRLAEPVHTDI